MFPVPENNIEMFQASENSIEMFQAFAENDIKRLLIHIYIYIYIHNINAETKKGDASS